MSSILLGLVPAAVAQSVPNGDFEAFGQGWEDVSEDCWDPLDGLPPFCSEYPGFAFDDTSARGAWSAWLDQGEDWGYAWITPAALSEPFVVTHDRLTWASDPGGEGTARLDGFGGAVTAGPASPDAFVQWQRDISAACGATARVRIQQDYGPPVHIDDVALGGAVCPEFVDADLDGYCPRGADLDGDGNCAAADELDLPGDCSEGDPTIGVCLDLRFSPWLSLGQRHRFRVRGASPGDRVYLVASDEGGTSCPPYLAGGCLDLADPLHIVASGIADASGEVTLWPRIGGRDLFVPRSFQAATLTARSSALQGWVVPAGDVPWDSAQPGVFNGDLELGAVGWPPGTGGYDLDPYGMYSISCPASQPVRSARGSQALAVGTDDPLEVWACDGRTEGWPFLVTRAGLFWASIGDARLDVRRLDDGSVVSQRVVGPALARDGFDEYGADLLAACGSEVWIELRSESNQPIPVVFDDIHLAGPPCPAYDDPDADGLCPRGVDIDGDGACVSAGEPDPIHRGIELPVERLLWDFEADAPFQLPPVLADAELSPVHTRGARSGYLDPAYALDEMRIEGEVVTHETMVLYASTAGWGDWTGAALTVEVHGPSGPLGLLSPVGPSSGPGVWQQHQIDLSGACGAALGEIVLSELSSDWMLDVDGSPYTFHNPDLILFDDFGFSGDVCPTLIDTDANGLCREGLDNDGDGLCVSTGEPTPGVVQDPGE